MIGKQEVLHSESRLGGIEDAKPEEVKPGPSIHLPFQAFQAIDLALDLSLAPRQGTRGINGLIILLHALGETSNCLLTISLISRQVDPCTLIHPRPEPSSG